MTKQQKIYSWKVYALTDSVVFAEKLAKTKIKVLQYRDKNISDQEFLARAKKIQKICRQNKVDFIINDRYYLIKKIQADGVHVGLKDKKIKTIRKFIGANKILGQSIKTIKQALYAQKQGVDYISVSPVFDTVNKKEEKGVGLKRLKEVRKAVKIPICAIGSITEKNLPQVIKAGADCAAFIGELINAKNLKQKINNLCKIEFSNK